MDTQLNWHKSTFSGQGNSCVEVADLPGNGRAVRDSKLGDDSPVLTFNAAEWDAFTRGVGAGEFD
jgi:hypothetical protein